MKNILPAILFLFLSFQVLAQPDNWYFSINMGGCWPAGSFANANPANADAGFAQRGFTLNLDATYPFSENWGIKGMVMLNSNPINRNGMGTMMETRMKKQVPFAETERDNLLLTVNPWLSNSVVVGPVFTVNFDKFSWDIVAMTGLNITYLPNQNLLFSPPDKNWQYLQRNTNTVSLSLDLLVGTAVRVKITDKVQLKLATDYQHSRATNKYEELKSTKANNIITIENLGSGSDLVRKQVVIGTVGFVYYL